MALSELIVGDPVSQLGVLVIEPRFEGSLSPSIAEAIGTEVSVVFICV